MLEAFIFTLIIFLAIIGISEVLHLLAQFIVKPKKRANKYLIIPLDSSDAEQQILSVLCEFKWSGKKLADKVIFLTDALEANTAQRLENNYKSSIAEFKNGVFYG